MAFEATKLPHERAGVPTRIVLLLTFGFLGFVVLLIAILAFDYQEQVNSRAIVSRFKAFPAPQLQPNPGQDYQNFLKAQHAELAGLRWVDEKKTLIHVPIERAMAYVEGRGSSAYDPLPGAETAAPALPIDGAPRAKPSGSVAPYGEHP